MNRFTSIHIYATLETFQDQAITSVCCQGVLRWSKTKILFLDKQLFECLLTVHPIHNYAKLETLQDMVIILVKKCSSSRQQESYSEIYWHRGVRERKGGKWSPWLIGASTTQFSTCWSSKACIFCFQSNQRSVTLSRSTLDIKLSIYIYLSLHIYIYIYTYIYVEREREGESYRTLLK
jgi:hypothetical protein